MQFMIVSRYSLTNNTGFSNAAVSLRNALSTRGSVTTIDEIAIFNFSSALTYLCIAIFNSVPAKAIFRLSFLVNFRLKIIHLLEDCNLALQVEKLLQKSTYDLIIVETGLLPVTVLRLLKIVKNKNIKTVVAPRFHATEDMERFFFSPYGANFIHFKFLIQRMLVEAPYIFATNSYHINFLKNNILRFNPYLVFDKIFCVVPNGIAAKPVGSTHIRAGLNEVMRSEKRRYLFCGKLSKVGVIQKGLLDLLEVFSNENILRNAELIIIGEGTELDSLRTRYKDSGQIKFLGKITNAEVLDEVDKSHYIVLPSRFEGQSIFLLECLSRGRPLIISADTGSSSLCDGYNGYLVEPGNVDSLQKAIRASFYLKPSDWEAQCIYSMQIFGKHHTSNKIGDTCISIFKK